MRTPLLESDVLLNDAHLGHLRPGSAADRDALLAVHRALSLRSLYLRYFTAAPNVESYLERLLRPNDADHQSLVALVDGRIVAVASYERLAAGDRAEVAFLVDDGHQGLGLGTLLLEHLAAGAFTRGITHFEAETLPGNVGMLDVFRNAGYRLTVTYGDGVVSLAFPIAPDGDSLAASDAREARANHLSMRRLLAPSAVAVVGAGRRPDRIGHQLVSHLLTGGFRGAVYPVNPSGTAVGPLPGWRSLGAVPDPLDLVVIAVATRHVLQVAREAAERRPAGLVVVSSGFAESGEQGCDAQRELLEVCRGAGMRLIGPNCMGLASHVDGVSVNAALYPVMPRPGGLGVMTQSGSVGASALAFADRSGVGLSSFVSAGNKADVSGNDLLCFWEGDRSTTICALYLESFGNPRKFSRIATRVGRTKPVVVVKPGRRSTGGAQAAPDAAVDALLTQAGVLRADSLSELFDIVRLLDAAPLPAGPRVAIVGETGGPGVLAADACLAAGLRLAELSCDTAGQLAQSAPRSPSVVNPVALPAGSDPAALERAVTALLCDTAVDSVIAVCTPLPGDQLAATAAALSAAAQGSTTPLLAVMLGSDRIDSWPAEAGGTKASVPFFAYPEAAAKALGAVSRYVAWRDSPQPIAAPPAGCDPHRARALVCDPPAGGWLRDDEAAHVLDCYGIPVHRRDSRGEDRDALPAAIGVIRYPDVGPVVTFGLGPFPSALLADTAWCIPPLGAEQAARLLTGLRAGPLLLGSAGAPPLDVAGLAGLVARVGHLALDLPEVAELDLSPVLVGPHGVDVTQVRLRLQRPEPTLPLLRRLSPA